MVSPLTATNGRNRSNARSPMPLTAIRSSGFLKAPFLVRCAMIALALACRPKLLLADEPDKAAAVIAALRKAKVDTGALHQSVEHLGRQLRRVYTRQGAIAPSDGRPDRLDDDCFSHGLLLQR